MLNLPPIEGDCAFFFDFDGTLADIAAHAAAVQLAPDVPALLQALAERCHGALAIVSGRPMAEIDHYLGQVRLPAAGVHGSERRDAQGLVTRLPLPDLGAAEASLRRWLTAHAGARLEVKPGALALHYRGADALEDACLAAMSEARDLIKDMPMALLHGKKVVELKPAAADKGTAVRAFMAEPVFAGRRPWFFGDDVTDEDALATVLDFGGVAVKIGPGNSVAPYRLAGPEALRQWLRVQVGTGLGHGQQVPA